MEAPIRNGSDDSRRRVFEREHPASEGWTTGIDQDGFFEAHRSDPETGCNVKVVMQPYPVNGSYPWYVRFSGTPDQVELRRLLNKADRPRSWWKRLLGQWTGMTSEPEPSEAVLQEFRRIRAEQQARAGDAAMAVGATGMPGRGPDVPQPS